MMALYVRSGRGFVEAPAAVVMDHARLLMADSFRPGAPVLGKPEIVEAFLATQLSTREHEVFAVILLNAQHRLIAYEELFTGSIDSVKVHIREVVKAALRHNAAAVILVHNHPGGTPQPSMADVGITQRVKVGLNLVDVRLLDHIVVGETVTSFAKCGMNL
jgi:DNA repair protein RadC